jgi:hypothetical protein
LITGLLQQSLKAIGIDHGLLQQSLKAIGIDHGLLQQSLKDHALSVYSSDSATVYFVVAIDINVNNRIKFKKPRYKDMSFDFQS